MNVLLNVRERPARAIVVCAAIALAGCGPNVKVSGKISRGGQPINSIKGMHLNVGFHPVIEASSTGRKAPGPDLYAANVTPDGSYSVPGVEGNGIPPGKYRVSIVLRPGRDRSEGKDRKKGYDPDRDYLNNAFGAETSPIVREVTSSQTLDIDLDKPSL